MLASTKFRYQKDFFGRPIDQDKSMFQKGVRLGKQTEALSGFFACYNMVALFPDNPGALAIQTNIINRLIICICEDICYANPALVRDLLPPLIRMSTNKRLRDARFLGKVVKALVDSPKSRWCSHAAAAFRGKEPVQKLKFGRPDCFTWLDTKLPELLARFKREGFFGLLLGYYDKCAAMNKITIARFILGLAHFLKVESEQGEFFRKGWGVEGEFALDDVDIEPYLSHDKSVYPDIPDYAIDVHTSKGRGMKRDRKGFRIVGARVENEHPLMNNKEYEAIYNNQ